MANNTAPTAPVAPHSNTPAIPGFTTFELAPSLWPSQLLRLAEMHRGWRAFVELISSDIGDQFVLEGLPLQGLTFETSGTDAGDLLIEVGDEPDFFIHRVPAPVSIRLADTTPGEELFIHVVGRDGMTTLIRLHRIGELPSRLGEPQFQRPLGKRPSRRAARPMPFPWGLVTVGLGAALLLLALPSARNCQPSE